MLSGENGLGIGSIEAIIGDFVDDFTQLHTRTEVQSLGFDTSDVQGYACGEGRNSVDPGNENTEATQIEKNRRCAICDMLSGSSTGALHYSRIPVRRRLLGPTTRSFAECYTERITGRSSNVRGICRRL